MRHAACAYAGSGQARRGARAARAAAPARRTAADRARLGDAAAAGARRLGRARRRPGSAPLRGGRRAQRRTRAARRADARPAGRRGYARGAGGGPRPRRTRGDHPKPQETAWTTPLDEDDEHATYDPAQVDTYFAAATRAAQVLAALRAPYRGRSTPVNAWWGSFDLAVSLFSGRPAEPPSRTSSCATRWTRRRSPSAGGPATRATRARPSMPTRTPRRRGSRTRR